MSTVEAEPGDGPTSVDADVPFLHRLGEPIPPHPVDRSPIASEPEPREESAGCLQRLMSVESIEVLEKGMKLGAQALTTVKESLEHAASLDKSSAAHDWVCIVTFIHTVHSGLSIDFYLSSASTA